MNIDFRVQEVGAETFVVELHVATLAGLKELVVFLMGHAQSRPQRMTEEELLRGLEPLLPPVSLTEGQRDA